MVENPSIDPVLSRRRALTQGGGLVALLSLLAGCSGGGQRAGGVPDVNWPDDELKRKIQPKPQPAKAAKPMPQPDLPGGVIPRSDWARGAPMPGRMTPAKPYYRITIHHDGMDSFTTTDKGATATRLEQIRQAHLGRSPEPFGDIGYHYLIDPAGRVWQGRPLQWQGAHVAKTNEGNLGICCLGNFQQQRPTEAQVAALDRFIIQQMSKYGVRASNVYTHRELGPTVCPGNMLQSYLEMSRTSGAIGRA